MGVYSFTSPEEPCLHAILLTLYGFIEVSLNCDTEFPPQKQELVGISSKASAFLFYHPNIRHESTFVFPKAL